MEGSFRASAGAGFAGELTHLSMDVQPFGRGAIVGLDQWVHFRQDSLTQTGRDFGDSARSQRKFQAYENDDSWLRLRMLGTKFLMIFLHSDGAGA